MTKDTFFVPNNRDEPQFYQIPLNSIYFIDKEYPTCIPCARRYLPELGCLWCDPITRKPKVHIHLPKEVEIKLKKPAKTYKSIWRQMEQGIK